MQISKRAEDNINFIVDLITNGWTWVITASVILMLALFSILGLFGGGSHNDTDMMKWCNEFHSNIEYQQCVEGSGV